MARKHKKKKAALFNAEKKKTEPVFKDKQNQNSFEDKTDTDFFRRHENEDENSNGFASEREEIRARRVRRKHTKRTKTKAFIADTGSDFREKTLDSIMEPEFEMEKTPIIPVQGSRKLEKLETKAEKASLKAEKAVKKLPRQKEYRLVKTVDEKGFDALRTKKQTGRPAKLSSESIASIKAVLDDDDPKKYGYNVWDGPSLSAYILKEYGVSLCVRQCQRLFHNLGFSLVRPQTFPSKNKEGLKEEREAFKKNGRDSKG